MLDNKFPADPFPVYAVLDMFDGHTQQQRPGVLEKSWDNKFIPKEGAMG